jgi:hypothetical protein
MVMRTKQEDMAGALELEGRVHQRPTVPIMAPKPLPGAFVRTTFVTTTYPDR